MSTLYSLNEEQTSSTLDVESEIEEFMSFFGVGLNSFGAIVSAKIKKAAIKNIPGPKNIFLSYPLNNLEILPILNFSPYLFDAGGNAFLFIVSKKTSSNVFVTALIE